MNRKIVTLTLNPAIDETVTISDFSIGNVNRVQQSEQNPGGKGINVSAFVSDYGLPVYASGFLGRSNDKIFSQLFEEKKIHDHCIRISGRTRIGIKISDPSNNETTDINYPGLCPSEDDIGMLYETLEELSAVCGWFVLSGSIPNGVGSNIYYEIVSKLKKKGAKIILDTSGEAFSQAVRLGPDIIKPNIEELSVYCGMELTDENDILGVAQKIIEYGTGMVIVSMGAEGALFITEKEVIRARPPRLEHVISTVGAGDAMVSGALCAIVEGRTLDETAALATAFSVVAVQNIRPGIPDTTDLKSIQDQVIIEHVHENI